MPAGTTLFPAGKIFAGCRVLGILGRGSSGIIYQAIQVSLERPVAVKVLASESATDAEMRSLLAEARTLGQLDHPNVVRVFNAGMEEGKAFIVMELLEGQTLQAILKKQSPLPLREALRIAEEVATGLQAAHRIGVVHRDLKPSNIYLRKDGRAKILDFGLAVAGAGTHGGTPEFMAPEQWKREAVDAKTDLYALGLVLYRMVVGKNAYEGDIEKLRHAHLQVPLRAPSPRPAALSEELFAVIRKLSRKHACERYQSAEEFLRDFERMRAGKPTEASKQIAKVVICPICDSESLVGVEKCPDCGSNLSRMNMTSDDLLPDPPPPPSKPQIRPSPKKRFWKR